MKTILLVRHAKSSWKDSRLDDIERPLNKRGKQDAPLMGKKLKERKILPDLILSSPAKRARKTAALIAEEIGYPREKIQYNDKMYHNGAPYLYEMVKKLDDKHETVMLVGHNPDFMDFVGMLLKQSPIYNIPTTGVYCIRFPLKSWKKMLKGKGKLVFFDYPKRDKEEAGVRARQTGEPCIEPPKEAGKTPGDHSAKPDFPLTPGMRSEEAARTILRSLLQVIRINEAHLAQDRDTEYLHDFRVAIRRTRSVLRQLKNVFPMKITKRFREDFSFVGNLSNELRDLDVHLQKEGPYKAMLPRGMRPDIDPLFDYLREKRAKAFREFLRQLETKKYIDIFLNWDLFLNGPRLDSAPSSNADLPVIELARKRIYKKYRGILKDGNEILDNTEDGKLHLLRIEGKELRYMLEFFSRLFPRNKISDLIEQLKKLQDTLGDFNDFRVEEQHLQDIARELAESDSRSEKTGAAMGTLIKALERGKETAKKTFAKTFSDYASASNRNIFRELFNPGSNSFDATGPQ